MSRAFRIEPEAASELEGAAVWYDQRRLGLGAEFLEAIDATLERIVRWPHAAPRVRGVAADVPARRAPVARFPIKSRTWKLRMPSGCSRSLMTGANPATGILGSRSSPFVSPATATEPRRGP